MPTTTSPTSRRLTPAQHAALTSLQMQAKFANELLQLLLRQRSEPIAPTDARKQRRELRRQLREAQLVMARHRPECDAIIRRAAAAGISIPTLTPTMLANLLLDPGYGSL